MKKLLFAVLALSLSAFAQNAPLTTSTFTTNFTALTLPGNHSTFVGTVGDVGLNVSPTASVYLETVQAPSVTNYNGFYGAGASYQINALSTFINNHAPSLSGYKFRFTILGSGGIADVAAARHVAGNLRFRTEYAVTSGGLYNLLFEVGAGRLYTSPGWAPMFAAGGAFHF